ncbi:MAG: hypothetical protein RIQ56_745, partial [Candidatus Parcubacteria bacterium]
VPTALFVAMEEDQNTQIRWSAFEHDHIERGNDWYLALAIAAFCIALTATLFNNALFGIVILLAAVTIAMHAKHPPSLVEFEVSDKGVRVGEKWHLFDEIIGFWVEDQHHSGRPLLLVDTVQFLAPNLIIPIEGVAPESIRSLMKKHTKEVRMKEPIAHKILEAVGF